VSDNENIDLDWAPVGSLQNRVVLRRSRTPFIIGLLVALAVLIGPGLYRRRPMSGCAPADADFTPKSRRF